MAGTLQGIGGILVLLVGVGLACFLPAVYLPASPALLAGIGLVLSAGTVFLVRRLAKGADRAAITRVALAILLAILCELLVVNFIKVCWGRPACGWSPTTRKPISSPGGGGALR